jgi:diadenylate cyclase
VTFNLIHFMVSLFIDIRILDIFDVILTALLFYQIYRIIKGTIAINIFAGIFAVYILWLLVRALNMQLLGSILGQVIGVGVIALIIVFQQEIRRFLLLIGTRYVSNRTFSIEKLFVSVSGSRPLIRINSLIKAFKKLSGRRIGALVVIARKSELESYSQTGDLLNAITSSRLLESIFCRESPLHDGAVIIIGDKIHAARCVLPVSENTSLPPELGMRHRAALGMSEQTDAVVVVISEETGMISITDGGKIKPNINLRELTDYLEKEFIRDPYVSEFT